MIKIIVGADNNEKDYKKSSKYHRKQENRYCYYKKIETKRQNFLLILNK